VFPSYNIMGFPPPFRFTPDPTKSLAENVAALPPPKRRSVLNHLGKGNKKATYDSLLYDWTFWARPKQLPPPGDWSVWVLRAGRGFGKTRTGAAWVHERALAHAGRWIALVARNPAEARDYMIEGPGGLLRNTHPDQRPLYEPSKKRLTWPNGSWATVYSAEEPDELRGFSGDTAWLDEFCKYKIVKMGNNTRSYAQEVWDNLAFGMREPSGDRPRRLITTTPRPIPLLKKIEAMPLTVVAVGTSYENRANLDPDWYRDTIAPYEGTRLGRQEISAEIVDDVPGALWTRALLDAALVETELPTMKRVVVGVDPSGTAGDDGANEVGIVAAGLGVDGLLYVLGDYTCSLSPDAWGRQVMRAYNAHSADRIVVESNFGGAMAEHVIKTVDRTAPIRMVVASRGKVVRAEPVAALYESTPARPSRVKHVPGLARLEDQLCAMTAAGYVGSNSPDRVDALVWAITDLAITPRGEQRTSLFAPRMIAG